MTRSARTAVVPALVAVAWAIVPGCSPGAKKAQPLAKATPTRADPEPLRKIAPFLGDFRACAWRRGVADDRSWGLAPGPSASYLRAFVLLDAAGMDDLLKTYAWEDSPLREFPATDLDLGDAFPPRVGAIKESADLIRKLPGLSTHHQGEIYLQPESRILYLELIDD